MFYSSLRKSECASRYDDTKVRACFAVTLVLSLFLPTLAGAHTSDYCDADFCEPGEKNVGCNPPPERGGPACLTHDAAFNVNLTASEQQRIVDEHNRLRSLLASGRLGSFAPASRMPLLVWDNELARQASHNARSCMYGHDECRNTHQFRFAGQNIALHRGPNQSAISFGERMLKQIHSWWEEYNTTTQEQLDTYPKNEPESPIGHFTQMVSDRTWKIGCSAQHWKESNDSTAFYFVCNYSFTNMIGQPVYVKGSPASRCLTGQDGQYSGLCSKKEVIFSTPSAIIN
uniref:Venom allergen-1 n=1 Tax=Anopheles farauti TaxID=69004 RepID=A0A182Q1W9_9DIPT